MTSRNITKALAGIQDLLTGVGTVSQMRNGVEVILDKIDIAFAVSTVEAMQALDVTKYKRARVYASESNYAEYVYDSTSLAGIPSDTGPGTWLPAPSSARLLAVEDRLSLRLVEPAYNLQIAIALGATALGVGFGGLYYYDETSVAADDGDKVFVTAGGARWLKLSLESNESSKVVVAAGGANALTASFGFSTVPTDQVLWFTAAFTNTGAATLDVDGLGASPIVYADLSALEAGAIEANKTYAVVFNGTQFELINPLTSQASTLAGTNNFGTVTPLRLAERLNALVASLDLAELSARIDGEQIDYQSFAADGTWNKPVCEPEDTVIVEIWSGGGSGAITANGSSAARGGGGGGYWKAFFRASDLNATEPVVVGQGGAPVSSSLTSLGNPGSLSSFKDIHIIGGGPGSTLGASVGGHRIPVGADVPIPTRNEAAGLILLGHGAYSSIPGQDDEPAAQFVDFGGGAGAPISAIGTPGSATKSLFGGDGGTSISGDGVTASSGIVPGGGGGAVHRTGGTVTSGAGARGEVRIKVIKGWHPEGFSHG